MLWRAIAGLQCCGGLPKDEEAADRARLEQHSTAQHSTARHGTARHSTAQRGCAVLPAIVTPVGPHLPVSGPHRAGCGRRYDRFREDRRAAAAPHRLLISGGSGGHSCSGAACVPLHAPLALLAASAQLHLIEPRLEDLRGQPSRCQSDGASRRRRPTEHADGGGRFTPTFRLSGVSSGANVSAAARRRASAASSRAWRWWSGRADSSSQRVAPRFHFCHGRFRRAKGAFGSRVRRCMRARVTDERAQSC